MKNAEHPVRDAKYPMKDMRYPQWKNDGKIKLLVIVGTRPEIIRLSAVINKCRIYFDTILAHTGQNYDYNLNGIFFKELGLADPEVYLDAVGEDLGTTMGNIIAGSYKLMAEKHDMPVLYSCHPRSRNRLMQMEKEGKFSLHSKVIAHEPLGFHDYNCLQMNAFCVVSDSGTLPEESSFFTSIGRPFPAVCIRTSTERPEALDKGCFILSGIDTEGLLQSVDMAVEMYRNGDYGISVPDYTDTNVSMKVVKIIQSYTGIINKVVWRKG